jgi:Domain of unknown function (DUF6259)
MNDEPRRPRFSVADDFLVADDGHVRLTFDVRTGGIRSIENLATGHVLRCAGSRSPWRLDRIGTRWSVFPKGLPPWLHGNPIVPRDFTFDIGTGGETLRLAWTTSMDGIGVVVDARFAPGAGELELWPRVDVEAGVEPPESFTYPIIAGPVMEIDDADRLAFVAPSHSGVLIRRPFDDFRWEAPYPDGYAGCSMQFMAMLDRSRGGLYLAAHDPHSTWKVFRFSGDEWSMSHHAWDLRVGTSLALDYPVVIRALVDGDWFEAAHRYREWAMSAPWTPQASDDGDGVDRAERAWLQEDVGLAIWGAPSSLDWSPWYRRYAEIAGTPLHICPMWDWTSRLPQSRGYEGWFPARFHKANLEAWDGHYVTPYMNDLFTSRLADDFDESWEPNAIYPYTVFPFTRFSEFDSEVVATGHPMSDPQVTTDVPFYMCPATEAQRDLHAWRDVGLMKDHDMAGVCYDISTGNPLQISRCLRGEHGHPPGQGRHMIEAADRMNRISKRAVRDETGRYLVQGVETIVENMIGSVDFYVARAGAGPLGYHEAWVPAHEEPPGTGRELLPMFEAVYHDVGPVRHDGWLTMAQNHGDLFFWAAARIVLQWGGLLSLHYSYGFAYNPPERLDAVEALPQHVNWDGATVEFEELPELDDAKAAFVRELAHARTSLAKPYLAHGVMLRPLDVSSPDVRLTFAGRFSSAPTLVLDGEWDVPSIVHGSWKAPNGDIGVVLVAVGTTPTPVAVSIDTVDAWGLDLADRSVTVRTMGGAVAGGGARLDGRQLDLDLTLEPRSVYLVEISEL